MWKGYDCTNRQTDKGIPIYPKTLFTGGIITICENKNSESKQRSGKF